LIPGVLLAGSYVLYILVRCKIQPSLAPPPSEEELAMPLAEKVRMAGSLAWPIVVIVGVMGSIYLGIASPTEAASVGVVCALLVGIVNRKLRVGDLREVVRDTGKAIGPVVWVVIGASALVSVYTFAGGVQFLSTTIKQLPVGPGGIVVFMVVVFLILGCFIDAIGIAVLTLPIFVPVIT